MFPKRLFVAPRTWSRLAPPAIEVFQSDSMVYEERLCAQTPRRCSLDAKEGNDRTSVSQIDGIFFFYMLLYYTACPLQLHTAL